MIRENVVAVADMILKDREVSFNMGMYLSTDYCEDRHFCNTAGCIAGFAAIAAEGEDALRLDAGQIVETAREYLGIDSDAAYALFCEASPVGKLHDVTREDAHKVLMTLADTGEVRWHIDLS